MSCIAIKRKIIKGDLVRVICGKDKGKTGRVLSVVKNNVVKSASCCKIIVSGVNIVMIRKKKSGAERGTTNSVERSIDISNVMYFDGVQNVVGRIGYKFVDGKKVRYCKSSGNILTV